MGMQHEENFVVNLIMSVISIIGFSLIAAMSVHTFRWYKRQVATDSKVKLSWLVFSTAIVSMALCALFLFIECIIFTHKVFVSNNGNEFNSLHSGLFWVTIGNDVIHRVGKATMYLFFFARFVLYIQMYAFAFFVVVSLFLASFRLLFFF